ncbi:DUF4253 domain-containing protein [Maricaulis sp.]|uniref:DUF4253 domain-containing protein n=1 Tax=Maricaulis sp. TaxID=1486257 RepID=UPI0026112F13|nr:DUF4253 domain-containing protein [Maricaulis sp.]MDF1769295.1 DUF4253 domain-containing protein [Maricaulis sp.]
MGLRDLLLWLFAGRSLPRRSDSGTADFDLGGDVARRTSTKGEAELAAEIETAFPYEAVKVAGDKSEAERARLTMIPGQCAAHLGDRDNFLSVASIFCPPPQGIDGPRSATEILAASAKVDLAAFRKAPIAFDADELVEVMNEVSGDWPVEVEAIVGPLSVTSPLTNEPHPLTHIGVFPTDDETEVPALLRWGAWNDCPAPEVHVAHLRAWRDAYGAKLVSVTRDTIELEVERRPASREEALKLAHEQFAYCPDIVLQGTQSIEALAASLMQSDWWFFWWD